MRGNLYKLNKNQGKKSSKNLLMLKCDMEIKNLLKLNKWGMWNVKYEGMFDLRTRMQGEGKFYAEAELKEIAILTLSKDPLKFWQLRMDGGSACGLAVLTLPSPGYAPYHVSVSTNWLPVWGQHDTQSPHRCITVVLHGAIIQNFSSDYLRALLYFHSSRWCLFWTPAEFVEQELQERQLRHYYGISYQAADSTKNYTWSLRMESHICRLLFDMCGQTDLNYRTCRNTCGSVV